MFLAELLDFAEVCSQSTDFHFPELADQLTLIEQNIAEHSELKARPSLSNSDSGSIKSGSSADSQVPHQFSDCISKCELKIVI